MNSIPPQKQMTGMLGHPVAENPIDRMFDAVYAHHGLHWQFWKNDIANVMPLLDELDDDVRAIGAANYITIRDGRLIGHNNDGKGVVKAIAKVAPLKGQRVVMLGAGGAGRAMAIEIAWAGAEYSGRMQRVLGIGGVFFKARDPASLGAWYRDHLGIDVQSWGGAVFHAGAPHSSVWSPFPADTTYFAPSEAPFMINFRVADVRAMVDQLRAHGCSVDDRIEETPQGTFGWVMDPEGNRVELWQPPQE